MDIYVVPGHLTDVYIYTCNRRFDSPITKITIDGFLARSAYLIDVFDTFILPALPSELTKGKMECLRERRPRAGFLDFLEHYKKHNKLIGIHSDSISAEEFEEIGVIWGIDCLVDRYFGHEYLDGRKNFTKMTMDIPVENKQTLVIGDGLSEIDAAIDHEVDLLLIPRMILYPNFSFEELIFKTN